MDFPVNDIIKACKLHFTESEFGLKKADINKFSIQGNIMSKALNIHEAGNFDINVLHWFDNFWVYLEISFIPSLNSFPSTFVSISFFQGEASDNLKSQLFRAEWDHHDDNTEHPQPHWHIHPLKYQHKIYEDFEAFVGLIEEENSATTALSEENKIVDIKKIHFAMNGQWSAQLGHVNKASEVNLLTNWMQGLFQHVKSQLHYVR
jgi:hypothetical protein